MIRNQLNRPLSNMTEQEHEQGDEQELERSPSGDIIYRYEDVEPAKPAEFQLAAGDEQAIEAISHHIEQHIGPISGVFHELISDLVHIDVHCVEPSANFPFHVLVMSGMSDLPMTVPAGAEDARYAEYMRIATQHLARAGSRRGGGRHWRLAERRVLLAH